MTASLTEHPVECHVFLFWVASLGDAGLVDHLENDKASPPEAPILWEEPEGWRPWPCPCRLIHQWQLGLFCFDQSESR